MTCCFVLFLIGIPTFEAASIGSARNQTIGSASGQTVSHVVSVATTATAVQRSSMSSTGSAFTYGFDLTEADPFAAVRPPDQAAFKVAGSMNRPLEDVPIMGWGLGNPEPSPGNFQFTELIKRVDLVQATGGTPIVTLSAAPDWMKGGVAGTTDWSQINVAPLPSHDADFATLCATIAAALPQVKYFVVWKELKGFWNATTRSWDAAGYTQLYNDVYSAIKAVRPDAKIGGPYVSMQSNAKSAPAGDPSGPWGALDLSDTVAVVYWVTHKVGADFVAVDGRAFTNDAGLVTDPVTSTEKYAAVDDWISSQTPLPIVWMESHLVPDPTIWSAQQQAAFRIAALIEMAASGAIAGLQWEPVDLTGWDEGIWSNTISVTGGQPTILGAELPQVLAVLSVPVHVVAGEPAGVVAVTGAKGTVTASTSGVVTVTPG